MEGTLAEIRLFAGNFAPRAWAFCQGQLMSIAQNTAVFALLGTTYGGDGQTTFGLPDFRGRVAVGTGQGPGLPNIDLGEMSGSATQTLTSGNLPAHSHTLNGFNANGAVKTVAGNSLAHVQGTNTNIYSTSAPNTAMNAGSITGGGSSQPFSIMQPYLGMNYIICLEGIFPSRN